MQKHFTGGNSTGGSGKQRHEVPAEFWLDGIPRPTQISRSTMRQVTSRMRRNSNNEESTSILKPTKEPIEKQYSDFAFGVW